MIPPSTHIGAVHLTIADLDRSIRFYELHVGLTVHRRERSTAWLGAGGRDLLVLVQSEQAPRVVGTTGLYHFAILVPTRADLARALRRLVASGTVMQGAADHGVSESLYLADVDGNGIEIYRDRPRSEWPFVNGQLRMGADPVDFDHLLAEASAGQASASVPPGTVIGHVHLHVAHLAEAEQFYVGVLGFELTQRYGPSALFVAAGGYHHHIGVNTWAGVGAPPPPPGAIGLRHFDVMLPSEAAVADMMLRVRPAGIPIESADGGFVVKDPSGNTLRVAAAGN